ncbi:MAG: HIT family protein [Desulfovibrio sp.]|nr:HIT family protein [Desulfovibrio sp.]
MADCIFCMIAEGKIPSSKIYESDTVYAFLDLNPVHKGHTLIIPKKHAKDLLRLPPELGRDVVDAMQKVGRAVMEATGADGFNVVQNNGRAAGQEVEHVHWHVIPRFDGDGLAFWPQTKYESMEAMNAMAERIRARIV